ncbi:MAG TPA: spore coat protein U domain-containing protein, partial [Steroidobacteraceae bacterium]|nr:spore coat protein U domain-containing protein [Steroidobacteraceae bacterium]
MPISVFVHCKSYSYNIVSTGYPHYVKSRGRALSAALLALGASVFAIPTFAAVTCTVSATAVAFGTYNPLNASPTVTTGTVTASCTLISGGNTSVNLVSSYSTGSSGTYAARTMKSGTNALSYN